MTPTDAHPRIASKDGSRRAVSTQASTHGSPAPLRSVSLPLGDDRPLTLPVSASNLTHASRSEPLPSPYPSGSNSSLAASTSTLRATSSSSRTPRPQSGSRRSTPGDSPTSGTARRLPTPTANANASSTSLSASREAVAKSPRTPAVDQPTPRFRTIPRLPNAVDVEAAPPSVMYPVWGWLPTHGFRAHTVTLADNVAWIFGGCDVRGRLKDMRYYFISTMQWSHLEIQGDLPPPCSAHSATLVGCKIVIGGGEGASYFNSATASTPRRAASRARRSRPQTFPLHAAHTLRCSTRTKPGYSAAEMDCRH